MIMAMVMRVIVTMVVFLFILRPRPLGPVAVIPHFLQSLFLLVIVQRIIMHDLLPLLHLLLRQKASVEHLRQPVNVELLSDEYLKIGVESQYLFHMQFVQRSILPFLVYDHPTLDIGMRS